MDSMESVMKGRGRVIDATSLDRVIDQYVQMFSRMTSNWKRVVYLSSPDAAFWDVMDRERYDWARDRVASLARSIGITVVDSTPMLRELRPYRDPDESRRVA